jgi:hypothetical protein
VVLVLPHPWSAPVTDIAFRRLILAKWLTVADAAARYGACDRTVRLWLARWPVAVKINDGRHRISEPLLDLCVSDDLDERAAGAAFLAGKPAGPLVRRAFGYCDALKALDRFEFERARPAMEGLAEPKRALRPSPNEIVRHSKPSRVSTKT